MASILAINKMREYFERNLSRYVARHPGEFVVLQYAIRGVRASSFHSREHEAREKAGIPENDFASVHYIPRSLPPKPRLHYVKGVGRVPSLEDIRATSLYHH